MFYDRECINNVQYVAFKHSLNGVYKRKIYVVWILACTIKHVESTKRSSKSKKHQDLSKSKKNAEIGDEEDDVSKIIYRWFGDSFYLYVADMVLIYFPIDDSLAIVNMILTESPLMKGGNCKVKEGKKIYDGKILEIGRQKLECWIMAVITSIMQVTVKLFEKLRKYLWKTQMSHQLGQVHLPILKLHFGKFIDKLFFLD